MNSVRSNNISLKYQIFTTLGYKDIGIVNSEFVAKTQISIRSTTLGCKDIRVRKSEFVSKTQLLRFGVFSLKYIRR